MSRKREREPLVQEALPKLPVWVYDHFGKTRAHLAIGDGLTEHGSLGVVLACDRADPQLARFFDLAHPDDIKCKKCLACERKEE